MSEPKTLLQMAGVESIPAAWDDSVLIMIDCQREYTDGGLPLSGVDAALDAGAKLLALARSQGAPVIHVQHLGRAGGLFDPDGEMFALCAAVAAETGEAIVTKALPNAFAGTDLADKLAASGRKSIIVAGFMTHMCVSSTARAALDQGYGCTVVADACATRDLPDGAGGVISADALHRAELAALADRFAIVVGDATAWD